MILDNRPQFTVRSSTPEHAYAASALHIPVLQDGRITYKTAAQYKVGDFLYPTANGQYAKSTRWQGTEFNELITLMDYWWIPDPKNPHVATAQQVTDFFQGDRKLTISAENIAQFTRGYQAFAEKGSRQAFEKITDIEAISGLSENIKAALTAFVDKNILTLTKNNYDHFYPYTVFAYAAGHQTALDMMQKARETNNEELFNSAVQLEAFAQHSFSDNFAGGHLLIGNNVRQALMEQFSHLGPIPALLINGQHNAGNKRGVVGRVVDENGKVCFPILYGDGNMDNPENAPALALQRRFLNYGFAELQAQYLGADIKLDKTAGFFPEPISREDYIANKSDIINYFKEAYKGVNDGKTPEQRYQEHMPIADLLKLEGGKLLILKDPSDLNPNNAEYVPLTTSAIIASAVKIATGYWNPTYKPDATVEPSFTEQKARLSALRSGEAVVATSQLAFRPGM